MSGNGPEHPEPASLNGTGRSATHAESKKPSLSDADTVQVPVPEGLAESDAESVSEAPGETGGTASGAAGAGGAGSAGAGSDGAPEGVASDDPSEPAGVNGNGHGPLRGMPPPWERMPAAARAEHSDSAVEDSAEDVAATEQADSARPSASIGELTGAGASGAAAAGAAGAGATSVASGGKSGADFSDYTDYGIPDSRTRGSLEPPTVRTRAGGSPSAHPRAARAASARATEPDDGGTVGGFPMSWPRNRRPRQAALQLKRLDPWSVLKVALVLAVVLYLVWLVAVGVLYGVLDGIGVWERLNGQYADLVAEQGGEQLISAGRVFGVAAVIGAVNSLLFAVALSVGAFVYNVSADLVGGVEVTLSERD